ncbi:hypothetical protein ACWGKW_07810 [Streptomyces sp. NPDC054766]
MLPNRWHEFDPFERADANRLGYLYETLQNDLHFHPEVDDFIAVLSGALEVEFVRREDGTYPPEGHSYPRSED